MRERLFRGYGKCTLYSECCWSMSRVYDGQWQTIRFKESCVIALLVSLIFMILCVRMYVFVAGYYSFFGFGVQHHYVFIILLLLFCQAVLLRCHRYRRWKYIAGVPLIFLRMTYLRVKLCQFWRSQSSAVCALMRTARFSLAKRYKIVYFEHFIACYIS